MSDLRFYQHLFNETLFVLPEKAQADVSVQPVPEQAPEAAAAPPASKPPAQLGAPADAPALVPVVPSETAEKSARETEHSATPYTVIGENRKGLVLLVHLPEVAFKVLPELEFLQKMLKAIGHGPQDVAYVNVSHLNPVSVPDLMAFLPLQTLISFGCPLILGSTVPVLYEPIIGKKARVLPVDSLASVQSSQEQKLLLWNALKKLFLHP